VTEKLIAVELYLPERALHRDIRTHHRGRAVLCEIFGGDAEGGQLVPGGVLHAPFLEPLQENEVAGILLSRQSGNEVSTGAVAHVVSKAGAPEEPVERNLQDLHSREAQPRWNDRAAVIAMDGPHPASQQEQQGTQRNHGPRFLQFHADPP
jgi:hypothetical protein